MLSLQPLSNHTLLLSKDLDEACDRIGHLLWPHRMRVLHQQSGINARVDGLSLNPIDIFCLQYGAGVEMEPGEINDYYLIQTTLSGAGMVSNGNRRCETRVGLTTIVSPSEPTTTRMDAYCRRLILRVSKSAMEAHLSQLLNRELDVPLVFDLSMPHSTSSGRAWENTLTFLCQQFDQREDVLRNPVLKRHFTDLVITQLLTTQPHNYSEQLAKDSSSQVLPVHVRRARDYIEANLGERCSLTELAQHSGVAARTLQNGFQRFLGLSPSAYVREQRMARVHQMLQQASTDNERVTDILLQLGIGNQGRFAQQYKRRYGCLPSQTLASS